MSIDDEIWKRALTPGTCGWSTTCLTDPQFADEWEWGRFEIIEGVLARRTANYLSNALALTRLLFLIHDAAESQQIPIDCCPGVEIILNEYRVVRADAAFFTVEDFRRQRAAEKKFPHDDERRYRPLVPPTLLIESTLVGYEGHDTDVKKRFYSEFGVPNYWILDNHRKTLDCFCLRDGKYVIAQSGAKKKKIMVSSPFAMTVLLVEIFRVRAKR